MRELTLFVIFVCVTLSQEQHQRVAPGVNPQQYQQAPPPQYQNVQYQQNVPVPQQGQIPQQGHIPQQAQIPQQAPVPQQHQVPVQPQYQQVPQQIPQQVPQQQIPVQQGHHDHHSPGSQILNAANIAQEREHIQEHMSVPIDTSKMSEQELQFHYFKMHDADNNNKLDGCELIKSLIHWHDGEAEEGQFQLPVQTDQELETLVDPIIKDVDHNLDGYIDYTEFKRSESMTRKS